MKVAFQTDTLQNIEDAAENPKQRELKDIKPFINKHNTGQDAAENPKQRELKETGAGHGVPRYNAMQRKIPSNGN